LFVLVVAVGAALANAPSATSGDVAANTRAEVWSEALAQFVSSPVIGQGFGSLEIVGSSYLQLARDLGLAGLILLMIVLKRCWVDIELRSPMVQAMFVAGVTAAFFESWLLAGGGVIAYAFWFEVLHRQRVPALYASLPAVPERHGATRRRAHRVPRSNGRFG
jgi:O-antigen ligase